MKNGMNKKVMMLHELQTPPVSSNLSSLRKQEQVKKKFIIYKPLFLKKKKTKNNLICLNFIRKESTAILSPF